jgi:hypothetical protein
MLKNLGRLSQLFGVERTERDLILKCITGFNRADFGERIEALRAISNLSMRLGAQRTKIFVLPAVNDLLTDAEDLVIVECIKMFN